MKKAVLVLMFFIFIVSLPAYAQKRSQIGITFSVLGKCDVLNFQKSIGGAGYHGDKYYSFGLIYLYKLNKTFDIETGIGYSKYKIIVTPNLPPQSDNSPYTENVSLIDFPVSLRVNFLKYIFINGGLGFDINAGNSGSLESQTGIGANLGLGLKYDFKSGLSVFANPYTKAHSLIPFSSKNNAQRIIESGFKFGLAYCF